MVMPHAASYYDHGKERMRMDPKFYSASEEVDKDRVAGYGRVLRDPAIGNGGTPRNKARIAKVSAYG